MFYVTQSFAMLLFGHDGCPRFTISIADVLADWRLNGVNAINYTKDEGGINKRGSVRARARAYPPKSSGGTFIPGAIPLLLSQEGCTRVSRRARGCNCRLASRLRSLFPPPPLSVCLSLFCLYIILQKGPA